jgi:hypothetical protein
MKPLDFFNHVLPPIESMSIVAPIIRTIATITTPIVIHAHLTDVAFAIATRSSRTDIVVMPINFIMVFRPFKVAILVNLIFRVVGVARTSLHVRAAPILHI